MTNIRHPQADILIAIAEGKQVQVADTLNTGNWTDVDSGGAFQYLNNVERFRFRIKPEKITGWMAIYQSSYPEVLGYTTDIFPSKEYTNRNVIEKPTAVIQVSYTPGEGLE